MCALVGESGSGKSTAVQLILRYYDVGGGRISVDGTDVRSWDVSALRSTIGLVSQEPAPFTGSIADNIKYGKPDASLEDVRHAASLANALQFIALPEASTRKSAAAAYSSLAVRSSASRSLARL